MGMINNALTGAIAAQTALNVTSQNVANVMTPGYTRQSVILAALQSPRGGPAAAGDGVKAPVLYRVSDDYNNLQMWSAGSKLGQHSTLEPYLKQLEQVMGDDSISINSGMDGFFGALNAASVEPTSIPLRQQVIDSADALAQRFNNLNIVLSGQRAAVHQQRTATVEQMNILIASIAKLNDQITKANVAGASPSGLMDERDNKIDQLASLIGIEVVTQSDGTRNVSLHGGQPIVVGNIGSVFRAVNQTDGSQTIEIQFANTSFGTKGTLLGGQLGGLADFEDTLLMPIKTSINDLAKSIATDFNNVLTSGFTMAGVTGQPLFAYDPSTPSSMLQVTMGLQPNDLGFSSNPLAPANNDKLLEAIKLKDSPISVALASSVLMGDVYTQIVSKLGTESQQNSVSHSVADTVRTYAVSNWKSTSGVNSDEEAMNLMQYQQMYQANMKVIAVANQLFDATLAMMN